MKRALIAPVAALALASAVYLFQRPPMEEAHDAATPATPSPPSPPSASTAPSAAPTSTLGALPDLPAPFASVAPPPSASSRPLHSPADTVSTQVALLQKGRDTDFRATFTPEAQRDLTSENIARCRMWLEGRPVKPHWAVAEESMKDGQRVVSVSMFGKSMTSFRETKEGVWQAETVWCLPPSP